MSELDQERSYLSSDKQRVQQVQQTKQQWVDRQLTIHWVGLVLLAGAVFFLMNSNSQLSAEILETKSAYEGLIEQLEETIKRIEGGKQEIDRGEREMKEWVRNTNAQQYQTLQQSLMAIKQQQAKILKKTNSESQSKVNNGMHLYEQKSKVEALWAESQALEYHKRVDTISKIVSSFRQSGQVADRAKNALMLSMATQQQFAPASLRKKFKAIQQYQTARLESKFSLKSVKQGTSFCVVATGRNNLPHHRYLHSISSILAVDYPYFHVILVDDSSDDGTGALLQSLLKQSPQHSIVKLVRNTERKSALPNIHIAIKEHCRSHEVVVLVDGDDMMLGRDTFRVLDAVYQESEAQIVYSNHLKISWREETVKQGWSKAYTAEQINNNRFRKVPQKIAHLRTFKVSLYEQITQQDLKDDKGQWFQSAYDEAMFLPMLQLACGKIEFIDEYLYLYDDDTGANDRVVDPQLQQQVADTVRTRPKRKCEAATK